MAEQAPPVTPVTPVVAPDPIPTAPVTSQDITPTQTQQAPALEVKQAAETSDALNKLFDEPATKVPTAPTEAPVTGAPVSKATETPSATPVGTEADFQAKLDAFKAPVGAHPNVAAGMDQLKTLALEAEKRAVAAQTKVADYEKMAAEYQELKAGNKLPEPVEKELNSLREWRREVDYRQDPEFQKNYVAPVQQAETDVMGLLKQAGIKENVEKFIQENGGIIRLSQSGELAGQSDAPNMTMAEWVEKKLLGPMPSVFKTRAIGKLTQAQDAIDRGRADLKNFQENSKSRWEEKMKTMEADFNAGRDEALAEAGDLAKPQIIEATDTPEQRVSKEAHNARLKKAAEMYEANLKTQKDPKTAGRLLAKATQADVILGLYSEAQATIKSLQAKLAGIKSAGNHSAAGDHSPPIGTEKPSNSDLLKKDTGSALNDLFRTTPVQ